MPLNPQLYSSLRRRFGEVKIAAEGDPAVFQPVVLDNAKFPVARMLHRGESYRVCCPFCGDRRFRLWINHRWNTIDPETNVHFGHKHGVRCFNEKCDLEGLVDELKGYIARKSLSTARPIAQPIKAVEMPEGCVRLDMMPDDHHSRGYLQHERGFDPDMLAVTYGVCYCGQHENPFVRDRIVIPIHFRGKLVGWQTRHIGEPPSKNIPKYWTMPNLPKRQLFYNFDVASQYSFGVIVEGITDVWRVGPRGAALLGNTITPSQSELARMTWHAGTLALCLDPEALVEIKALATAFSARGMFRHQPFDVELPQGSDPGQCQVGFLWDTILAAGVAAGVPMDQLG
jgi:hypothetical protein